MKQYKTILLGIMTTMTIEAGYATNCLERKCFYVETIRKVCLHQYSDNEIETLETSANNGNKNAQFELGIIYEIKAAKRYQQFIKNKHSFIWTNEKSPCERMFIEEK